MIVAEVAMEVAYHPQLLQKVADRHGAAAARACAMSNSVGGIGPLLKERIPAQVRPDVEVIGVSLLYANVWTQGFYSWGQIYIEKREVGKILREVLENTGLELEVEMPDDSRRRVQAWKMALDGGVVYYLDDPEIANVVYPGPEDAPHDHPNAQEWVENQKLRQSWLVGRGALALLKALDKKPDVIVQSETPTFFAHPRLILDAFQKDPFFDGARTVFNDHTPLEYAHPVWNEAQIARARLDPAVAKDKKYFNAGSRTIDVTRLLIGESQATFGVSLKHRAVMRAMPSLRGLEEKITSITNGVSVPFWQHPDYAGWQKLADAALLAAKDRRRAELIQWVWKRYKLWVDWRAKVRDKSFVNWTRRVTTYKRFDVLDRLLTNAELRRRFLATNLVVLVGGRIHQNDNLSQNVMFTLLDIVTRDPELKDRVIVLDNYNLWDAPKVFHGVDGTIMLADDGREASATGFMKAQVNGALVLACDDGAIPESVKFLGSGQAPASGENGFLVPYIGSQPQPEGLVLAFEELDRVLRSPDLRAPMMRNAFAAEGQVRIDRTADEMIKLYVHTLHGK